jgi:hypothetical protein
MTARKRDLPLPARTPAYVSREVGAAELCISPDTWDEWVAAGLLPPPRTRGASGASPRWRWADCDQRLCGQEPKVVESPPEPFFRDFGRGQAKDRRRVAS